MKNSIKLGLYNAGFGAINNEAICACGLFVIDALTKILS